MSSNTEKEWLERLRKGEESALQSIFNRYYSELLGQVYTVVSDRETCKDIAQEVFVELWKKRQSLDVRISLRAYLRRAAINRALNFIKSQKRYQFGNDDTVFEPSEASFPTDFELSDNHLEIRETALHEAIALLPEKCRMVFQLSRFQDLSHKEIAAQLDISVKTIENQITKALKMIRENLLNNPDLSSIIFFIVHFGIG